MWISPRGGIGRRCGLKIRCPLGRASSSLAAGTIKRYNLKAKAQISFCESKSYAPVSGS